MTDLPIVHANKITDSKAVVAIKAILQLQLSKKPGGLFAFEKRY